jgi:hypothetical protein
MPKTIQFVIVSGWVLLLVACFGLISAVAYLALTKQPIDPALKDLAGPAFGFVFGSIPPLVKDLLTKPS